MRAVRTAVLRRLSSVLPVAIAAAVLGLAGACATATAPDPAEPGAPLPTASVGPEGPQLPPSGEVVDASGDRGPVLDASGELEPSPEQARAGIPYVRFRIDVGDAPSRGPADAPVTIVMFSDFECPYCARGLAVVEALEREYAGQIRFVYKAFPLSFHPNAMNASMMAHSALAQDKFWPFHDLLFSQSGLDPDTLDRYGTEVGLDMTRVRRELDELTYAPAVRRDLRQAKRLAVRSTPTFFINGRYVRGAQPLDVFRSVVEQELVLTQQWIAEAVASADLYGHATEHGYVEVTVPGRNRPLDEDMVFRVPIGDSPRAGLETALITVVVFGDFECPFCVRGFETMQRLQARYGDQMRLVYKHFPLPSHRTATVAAKATIAAHEQGKFWAFHDALYGRRARFSEADVELIAMRLGLDMGAFRKAMESERLGARLEADLDLGTMLGVTGTPTFFVNGRPLGGAQPELSFRMLFVEELERAQALIDRGVAPERLYEELVSP